MKPTEKEWKKACKREGCFMPEFHKVLFEYANLPAYMRVYCGLWGIKEFKEQISKELKDNMFAEFYGDDNLSNKKYEKLLKRINKRIDKVLE